MSIGYRKEGFKVKVRLTRTNSYVADAVSEWESVINANVYYTSGTINLYYEKPLYQTVDMYYNVKDDTAKYYFHYFINDVYWKTGTMYGAYGPTGQWKVVITDDIGGGGTPAPEPRLYLMFIQKSDGYYFFRPSFYLKESGTGYRYYAYTGQGVKVNAQKLIVDGFPYGDGESVSQGGQGEMTDTTEPIEIDTKPLLTTGEFLKVYKMTAANLSALRDKLVSDGFLDGLLPKLRTDAMDYIIGLSAIPLTSTNVAEGTIKIGNLDTEINASYLTWYIEDLECGEIELKEYFQTFMDYSPYTKISVYLPFCGIIPLNVDNFMDDKIKLKYRIDLLTGQCLVFISNSTGIVTTASGSCAYQLPIRANDYSRFVSSGLGLAGGVAGTYFAAATGNIPLAVGLGLGTAAAAVSTSQAVDKPEITSNGSLAGSYGLLGNRTPYLIIQRPTISVPKDYGKTIGYMSRIHAKLGDLKGFTKVEEIHLEHINATDDEKTMIENLLKEGVIL